MYLGLSILELREILMYEFWCDYVKAKSGKKAKLCWKDTDSFIVYIKTDDIYYKDIAEEFERRFDMSNYESECSSIERPLPKGKSKKIKINKRWIRQKNHDKICWIKSKNLLVT